MYQERPARHRDVTYDAKLPSAQAEGLATSLKSRTLALKSSLKSRNLARNLEI